MQGLRSRRARVAAMVLALVIFAVIAAGAATERSRHLVIALTCTVIPAPCLRIDTYQLHHSQSGERITCKSKPYWGLPGGADYQEYFGCIDRALKDGYVPDPKHRRLENKG